MERKDYFLGIDFGTSNSCVSIYINSQVTIVPNSIGEKTTPSIVSFSDKIYVGEETLDQKIEGNNLISEVKRFIGLDYDEFIKTDFAKKLNYDVINQNGKPLIKVMLKGEKKYYSPEEISCYIIKKMVRNAEEFINDIEIGIKIKKAVITIPVNFNKRQRDAIKLIAEKAGLDVVRCIKEPTAAALAYGLGNDLISYIDSIDSIKTSSNRAPLINEESKTEQNVLVFDLGGGTFDLTLLNIKKEKNGVLKFEAKSNEGKTHLGGTDFDNRLKDYCIKSFCNYTGYDENDIRKDKKACKKLSIKCEAAKKLLSISDEVDINILDFYNNEILSENITNALFDNLCKDLFEKIKKTINDLFKEYKKNPEFIDAVILIGGATRMTGIKKLLKTIFKDEKKIKDNIDPDVAVAMGATIAAMKIEKNDKVKFILQDIIPYNLGTNIKNPIKEKEEIEKGDLMYPIIRRNSKIPCSGEESFSITLTEKCRDINVNIYEGKEKYVKDNKRLDTFSERVGQLGEIKYKLQFQVDVNSKLTVKFIIESLGISNDHEIKEDVTNAFWDKNNNKIIINKSKSVGPINSIIANINNIKESLFNSQDLEERINNLMECSKEYEELINKYLKFEKYNDYVIEKVYINTKELFNLYLERISLINNKNKIDNVDEIIKKINQGMKNVISVIGYVSDLLNVFIESKEKYDLIYFYTIFANYMELMNIEGMNRIEKKKFSRYFSKLYFEKVFFSYKKYILNGNLATIDRDNSVKKKLEEQLKITEMKLKEINSFAFVIENIVNENKFLYGKTGFTKILKKIEKLNTANDLSEEEMIELYDIFKNMVDSYDKKRKSIGEAYCLANLIKISYKIIKNADNDVLMGYIYRFREIMKGRDGSDYKWYAEISGIIDEIENEQ